MSNPGDARTVLYVEDEHFDRVFMELAFEKLGRGPVLRTVTQGSDAIGYLSGKGEFADRTRHPLPSLVLLDLNLGPFSGFEVLEWMRQQPAFRSLPVVIFSSSSRPEDKAKAAHLGALDYIQKPSSGLRFGEVIKALQDRWPDLIGK